MHSSGNTPASTQSGLDRANADAVLVREAGLPFRRERGKASGGDPFIEWLSLMEVVQMLCTVWPVRDKPIQGNQWRI
jgi:hypothetical protein